MRKAVWFAIIVNLVMLVVFLANGWTKGAIEVGIFLAAWIVFGLLTRTPRRLEGDRR